MVDWRTIELNIQKGVKYGDIRGGDQGIHLEWGGGGGLFYAHHVGVTSILEKSAN